MEYYSMDHQGRELLKLAADQLEGIVAGTSGRQPKKDDSRKQSETKAK